MLDISKYQSPYGIRNAHKMQLASFSVHTVVSIPVRDKEQKLAVTFETADLVSIPVRDKEQVFLKKGTKNEKTKKYQSPYGIR